MKEYSLTLKGSMGHVADLGADTFGNITRINNVLKSMPQRIEKLNASLDNLHKQMADAKV